MDRTDKHVPVGGNEPNRVLSDSPSDNLTDVRPNNLSGTPVSPSTAAMSVKSNAGSTSMTNKGTTSAATRSGKLELLEDNGLDDDVEDDELEISDKDIIVRQCVSATGVIQIGQAIERAKVKIPQNLELHRATIRKIQQFFAKSDEEGATDGYMKFRLSIFIRCTTEKVEKAYSQYLVTGDNLAGMPSKAEILAIRFCNPDKSALSIPNPLAGYLMAMDRADLVRVDAAERREGTLLGALASHFSAVEDMKKRIRVLEKSAPSQELENLTKKSNVMETAIQDFRVLVKGALDRRPSKVDLDEAMAKFRDEAMAKFGKQLNDLAEKHAQDLKALENRFQESLGARALASHDQNTKQAPKRPSDDAHRADGNQAKKRRLDDTTGKMDFSDIV